MDWDIHSLSLIDCHVLFSKNSAFLFSVSPIREGTHYKFYIIVYELNVNLMFFRLQDQGKMTIDFYYIPLSAPCRSVLLAANMLGVELNLKYTDLDKGDHLKPEFIKVNIIEPRRGIKIPFFASA